MRLSLLSPLMAALAFVVPASAQVVISQVYGGGGNSQAPLRSDYIELFNRGNGAVSINGWSVQYASSAGSTWQVTALPNISIAPGRYFLVKQADGANLAAPALPDPDATGTIAMSATSGKVALVNNATALSGACPTDGSIQDFLGYGPGASCSETLPTTPDLSNTLAALRAGAGCTDTGNNRNDFSNGAPAPRNSASPVNPCTGAILLSGSGSASPSTVDTGASTLLTVTVTPATSPASTGIAVSADLTAIGGSATQAFFDNGTNGDVTAGDNIFSYSATVAAATTAGAKSLAFGITDAQARSATGNIALTVTTPIPTLSINQIQGPGTVSPFEGQVVRTTGIVTARRFNGFFLQNPDSETDADPNTSEGLFVFTGSNVPAAAQPGNRVNVQGTALEFRRVNLPTYPSLTQISSNPTVTLVSTGNPLPAPIALSASLPSPTGSAIQLERYEGMRVTLPTVLVVAPTDGTVNEAAATAASNGIFFATIPPNGRAFREPGIEQPNSLSCAPGTIPCFDSNPEVFRVDSDALLGAPVIDVATGDSVAGLTGVLYSDFNKYEVDVDPAASIVVTAGVRPPRAVPTPAATELTVASINLERFYDTVNDPGSDAVLTPAAFANRLSKASLLIREDMKSPDIVGVVEMENLAALQALAAKIQADGGPMYQPYLVEGNDPGLIDVGYLVKTPKVSVTSVVQLGKTDTFVDPTDGSNDIIFDRPPLVLNAVATAPGSDSGLPVTVLVNHLRSLNDIEDAAAGPRVRAKRRAQAELTAAYLQARQAENVVAVGDFNAFEFNDGYVDIMGTLKGAPTPAAEVTLASPDLVNPNYTNLTETLPASERATFSFSGNSQAIDHQLVNAKLLPRLSRYAITRSNADYPEILRNDPTRPERITDHEGTVSYFRLPIEVTSKFQIFRGNVTFNPAANLYTEVIRIQNTSGAPIAVPLFFEFANLAAGVTVTTTSATVNGNPVQTAKGGSQPLPANASLTLLVQYRKPAATVVTFTPRIYSETF